MRVVSKIPSLLKFWREKVSLLKFFKKYNGSIQGFESAFEDELPSCYCLYTFYIHQNQRTTVCTKDSNPQWKYRAEHRVEQNANLHRYLQSDKLKIIVCDADDDGDDKADYLCCGDIELASLGSGIIHGVHFYP